MRATLCGREARPGAFRGRASSTDLPVEVGELGLEGLPDPGDALSEALVVGAALALALGRIISTIWRRLATRSARSRGVARAKAAMTSIVRQRMREFGSAGQAGAGASAARASSG